VASQLNFICQFLKDSKRAKKRFGDAEYQRLLRELSSKGKQSESNRASNMESFASALLRPRKRNKAEKPTGIDTPAAMGGGILLRILTKKNGLEGVVNAEITAREIPMSKKQQESWNIAAKRKKLRRNEMQRLAGDNVKALNGIKESDITYIVPVSEEMNGTFELQEHILAKELRIEDDGECEFELYR